LLAVALLCAVLFGLVFPFSFEGRLSGEVFDLAHAPVFAAALLCLVGFFDPRAIGLSERFATILPMSLRRVAIITVLLTLLGMTGEYLQKFAGRSPSWGDIIANSIGLAAALAWITSRLVTGLHRRWLALAAVGLLVIVSIRPLTEAWDCIQQIRSFPLLASFERSRELGSWATYKSNIERSTEWASDGEYSLKAHLPAGRYPGFAMVWFNHDWSDYDALQLDLMNPNAEPLPVVIKLFDEHHTKSGFDHHDRFHKDVLLPPGESMAVRIALADVESAPEKRTMKMKRIWAIEIFSPDVREKRELFVDHVRLTK